MPVQIGHATGRDTRQIGGTTRQIFIRDWFRYRNRKWVLLRCKDPDIRERIAAAMEMACANPNLCYDHSHDPRSRGSLYQQVRSLGFDPSKTSGRARTDCSGLVRVCIAYACGRDRTGYFHTGTEPAVLVGTGLFECLEDARYCESDDYVLRGDILCTLGRCHTAVVLESGPKTGTTRTAAEPARCHTPSFAGTYVTTAGLNIRSGAGIRANLYGSDKTVLVRVPRGTKLLCCGGHTTVGGRRWMYVHFVRNGVTYTGFASDKYMRKI